jgi:hypothetical protein
MPAEMFKVIAKFVNAEGASLTGVDYMVRMLDKDLFLDDKLGSSSLDENGVAEFRIYVADIISIDSPGERKPDIYFIVTKGGREIFQSEVFSDVNFDEINPVTGRADKQTKDLGTFVVPEQT